MKNKLLRYSTFGQMNNPCNRCSPRHLPEERGRSMIEMLGVLAIIGVLSIGSLAGYRAAVKKHELIRYTQQMDAFFAGMYDYIRATWRNTRSNGEDMIEPAIKGNFLPDDMISATNKSKITDYYGNNISATYSTQNGGFWYLLFPTRKDACTSLLRVIKSNADMLWQIWMPNTQGATLYGTQYCSTGVSCLEKKTETELRDWCLSYCSSGCNMYTYFTKLAN